VARSVRRYEPADRRAVEEICFQVGFMGEPASVFWPHRKSFVDLWAGDYLDREPESAFVAIADGALVGYLVGCVDTASWPDENARMMRVFMRHKLPFRPSMTSFLVRSTLDAIRDRGTAAGGLRDPRWPSHLHINLVEMARGTGLGSMLMTAWLEHARTAGSPGCHLSTMAENSRALSFFAKHGFTVHGTAQPIPGVRTVKGGRVHQLFMVRTL
jgi:ribosomal protein S18 acetylase RimI-like enzyme